MKLTWIGHSCFVLEEQGYKIVIDPYEDEHVPGLKPVREEADLVLCTHEHGDHNARHCVTLRKNGVNPFRVTAIPSFHDEERGTLRGTNTIYLLESDDLRIAHFGDIGCALDDETAAKLQDLDLALIPVGGYYTINAGMADSIVKEIRPGVVIPMHYRGKGFGFDVIDTVDSFLAYSRCVVRMLDSTVDIHKNMPEQVLVLLPENKV